MNKCSECRENEEKGFEMMIDVKVMKYEINLYIDFTTSNGA